MNTFRVRKITYIICACEIFFPIAIAFDIKHGLWYLAVMIFGIMTVILLLLKYWKCPYCKKYFPLTMSLDAKHCPKCGEKLQ